jgi:hypothetical protein
MLTGDPPWLVISAYSSLSTRDTTPSKKINDICTSAGATAGTSVAGTGVFVGGGLVGVLVGWGVGRFGNNVAANVTLFADRVYKAVLYRGTSDSEIIARKCH